MTNVLRGDAAQSAGHTRLPARTPPAPTVATVASASPAPAARPFVPVAAPAPVVERGPSDAELLELRERAREAGFAQGLRDAQSQAGEAAARRATAWAATLAKLEADVARQLQHVETLAIAVAFEACSRVLGDAALEPALVAAAVGRLLADTRETGLLRVQVSPADLEAVQAALRDDAHRQRRQLVFEADRTLGPGECRVVSTHGQFETSLPVQLDAIRQTLLATFADRARERSA